VCIDLFPLNLFPLNLFLITMVLQLPSDLKDNDQLSPHDLPAVEQFAANDAVSQAESPLLERGALTSLNAKQLPQTIVNNLSAFLAPEHLAGPLKLFYRPIFVAAIGLHALLLFSGGKPEEKKEVKEKEKPVTITQIATGKAAPKPLKKLGTTELKKTKLPKLNNPLSAQAPVIKGTPKPEESKVTEDSEVVKDGKTTPETQTFDRTSERTSETAQQSQSLPKFPPMQSDESIDPNNPFADFPHMGSKNADGEYVVPGKTIGDADAHFSKALPGLKYTIEPVRKGADRIVYKFSKGGKEAYLNIFQDGPNVVYFLAPDEVESLKVLRGSAKIPEAFVILLSTLPSPPSDGSVSGVSDENSFAQPDAFFDGTDALKSGIDGSPKQVQGYDPDALYTELIESDLRKIFEVTDSGSYGGGKLREMKKGKLTLFLNLVPTPSGGTNVVVWKVNPNG
jgi:hypothetical protein